MHFIKDIYPLQAQYLSGEQIQIALEVYNPTDVARELQIEINIMKLCQVIQKMTYSLPLEPKEEKTIIVELEPQNTQFDGFGIDAYAFVDGIQIDEASSSFDVVDNWRRATRYGFLSDFYLKDRNDEEDVKNMRKFHINLVQFYDWMYRHDCLVGPTEYNDLMGRKLSLEVVKEKIGYCHKYGMKAVAYGAVYAASKEFCQEHQDWALFNSNGDVYDFINIFKIMNISPESPWHNHIIGEYKKAICNVGFDGIHMDTYGYPKTGVSHQNGINMIEELSELFPVLIDNTRKELEKTEKDICLIFNNVGNWPVDTVSQANQDAIYIEVWKPYERYHHIQQIILWAKHFGREKQVILAAYLKPFMEQETEKIEAQTAALLLTAVISANGAYHLLNGENNGVLTQGYYVDYTTINSDFSRQIRYYYDFIVRYSNILFDNFRDVSMTHCDGDNLEYVFENIKYSTYGEPEKVWVIIRENSNRKTISLINLVGNTEDYWNKGKHIPEPHTNISIRVQITTMPRAVYSASPDFNFGRPDILDYVVETSDRGKYIVLKLPMLNIWDLIVMEF